jgi:hypothetical protein
MNILKVKQNMPFKKTSRGTTIGVIEQPKPVTQDKTEKPQSDKNKQEDKNQK